jgi:peptidyl-prolyl cis-trans isomerase SurA
MFLVFSKVRYLFETDFGFHIIYVEKSKDKKLNYVIYYWLLQYLKKQTAAREKISLIRNKIIARKLLLLKLPEQNQTKKETRANGGSLINPKTQDTRFELTKWIQVYTVKFQAWKTMPFLNRY